MPFDVVLPQLGESVVEGTLTKWLIKEGDQVAAGQPVAEVATDKADNEIPTPVAGRVLGLLVAEGETIPVGKVLTRIDEAQTGEVTAAVAAAPAAPAAGVQNEASSGAGDFVRAAPSVRDLARQLEVPLQQVTATGEGGRITSEDIRRAAPGALVPPPAAVIKAAVAPQPPPVVTATAGMAGSPPIPNVGFGAFKVPIYIPKAGDKTVPFSRKRRITADHMVYSKFVSPQVVTVAEVDVHRAMRLREAHKERYKKEGVSLTVLAFVCSAIVRALRAVPGINARVIEGATVLLNDINLGVAVDAPDGLVVPNLKHADELSLRGMARSIGDLAVRARDGKLTADDFSGSSFTVTNPGIKGNLFGGAIISQPNVAILRMGEIKKRVVVVEENGEDRIAIHPVMYLALSYDHRVVDGVLANSFLWTIADLLKQAEFEP